MDAPGEHDAGIAHSVKLRQLARLLFHQSLDYSQIAERLYGASTAQKIQSARQLLGQLRATIDAGDSPLPLPDDRCLSLHEGGDDSGRGRRYQIRSIPKRSAAGRSPPAPKVKLVLPGLAPSEWVLDVLSGLRDPGRLTPEGYRLIPTAYLYMGNLGTSWMRVTQSPKYLRSFEAAGAALAAEADAAPQWLTEDVIYVSFGPGAAQPDTSAVRALFEAGEARGVQVCVRALLVDLSLHLLQRGAARLAQAFPDHVLDGRLDIIPVQADFSSPDGWVESLPTLFPQSRPTLVVAMFGNTFGHLRNRGLLVLTQMIAALQKWALDSDLPAWSVANSRFLLGVSSPLGSHDAGVGGPVDEMVAKNERRALLNLVSTPLRAAFEVDDRLFLERLDEGSADALGELIELDCTTDAASRLGAFVNEIDEHEPTLSGLEGQLQLISFVFARPFELDPQDVLDHHGIEERWTGLPKKFGFRAGERIVVCEVIRFPIEALVAAMGSIVELSIAASAKRRWHDTTLSDGASYAVIPFAPKAGT